MASANVPKHTVHSRTERSKYALDKCITVEVVPQLSHSAVAELKWINCLPPQLDARPTGITRMVRCYIGQVRQAMMI